MQIQMNDEQKKLAEVFSPEPAIETREDRLVLRFDPETTELYRLGKASSPYRHSRSKPIPGREAIVLEYKESPAETPTGGRYMRKGLTVRTRDGKRWWGMVKKGTDIIRLRPAEEVGE